MKLILDFGFFEKEWNQGCAAESAKTSLIYGLEKLRACLGICDWNCYRPFLMQFEVEFLSIALVTVQNYNKKMRKKRRKKTIDKSLNRLLNDGE